ncbi:NAD(P)H-hydrate dehydratase [Lachnospiraceae bacterium 62-26]
MRYLVNSSQMKKADSYTIQKKGILSLELMERAARACVDVMTAEGFDLSKPCVVCGSGNNGGDGFAVARLLMESGVTPFVCFAGDEDRRSEETIVQMQKYLEIGGRICNEYRDDEYSIIIDAVFGVGLRREITGGYADVIERMNRTKAVKFAVDMPSGISADTGSVLGTAFRADVTVTFQAKKLGLVLYPGKEYAGKVVTVDIGIDMEGLTEEGGLPGEEAGTGMGPLAYTCEFSDHQSMLPVRRADSNKGSYGKLLMIAGSRGMSGAAFLNGSAAYLSGAGLVRIYTSEENRVILQQQLPEAVITTYTDYDREETKRLLEWADTVCIGSGMGMSETSVRLVEQVLREAEGTCLIDADGLNILAEHKEWMSLLKREGSCAPARVLTPHMKEMSRLTGHSIEELKERRIEIVKEFADRTGCTCVLKDARTVTASPSECFKIYPCSLPGAGIYVNLSGNAAMAKAGAGDVLAGIISALLAQGLDGHKAASLGTYLHGRSGDYARKLRGSYSVLARDLLLCISEAFKELEEGRREEV